MASRIELGGIPDGKGCCGEKAMSVMALEGWGELRPMFPIIAIPDLDF